ncbi:hypothetical protein A5320_00020 [Rheinheimera sp. SA_1]|nr:hypothetical protein A5320_00020 [Rheinheimera sp. SA_1]
MFRLRKLVKMKLIAASYWRQSWSVLLLLLSVQLSAFTEPLASKSAAVITPEVEKPTQQAAVTWRLYRKSEQFEMSYRDTKTDGRPVLEIKAQFVFKGRMSAFLQVLRDTEHAGQWLDSTHSVKIIASPSPFEDWVHTIFDTPWPLQQRDMVTCSTWKQHIDYSIEMIVIACDDKWPVATNTVRIKQINARWLLQSLPDHLVHVTYIGAADAGGGLPRWLSDRVVIASSLRSFRALQQQLSQPDYQQIVAEVCEPEMSTASQALPADVNTTSCQRLKSGAK